MLLTFLTWPIPGGRTVRHMEVDRKGYIWLAESGVGTIAGVRVTKKTMFFFVYLRVFVVAFTAAG